MGSAAGKRAATLMGSKAAGGSPALSGADALCEAALPFIERGACEELPATS